MRSLRGAGSEQGSGREEVGSLWEAVVVVVERETCSGQRLKGHLGEREGGRKGKEAK